MHLPGGSINDIDINDYNNNKDTCAGNYAKIIQRLKIIQPKAKFFFVTMPKNENDTRSQEHTDFLYSLTNVFDSCYVIEFDKYGPIYDKQF